MFLEVLKITNPKEEIEYIPVNRDSEKIKTVEQAKEKTLYRSLEIERNWINEEDRTIEIPVSSEYRVRRLFGDVILGHNSDNVDLTRIRKVGSFLFAHGRDPNFGKVPIGPIQKVWLKETEKRLWAILKFDESEESEKMWQKVLSKSIKGVSIGFTISKLVRIREDEEYQGHEGPARYAEKWAPHEISLEPTPADPTVGGRSNQNKGDDEKMANPNEEEKVSTEEENDNKRNQSEKNEENDQTEKRNNQVDENEVKDEGKREERERVKQINQICRNFEEDPTEYIEKGHSVQKVREIMLDKLAEERKAIPTVNVSQDGKEKMKRAISDCLTQRAGVEIEEPEESAKDFRGYTLMELAREICKRNDINTKGMPKLKIAERAIFGTGDFPAILADVANKTMMKAYEEVPTTYQRWTKEVEASDFKEMHRVQISEAPDLDEIQENGEYKHAEFSDNEEKYSLSTYGKKFSVSRKAIINDDMGALTRIPRLFGASAARKANQLVYNILTSNPTMADDNALFHTSKHSNLASSGSALSVESLGSARAQMRKQTALEGKATLNVVPKFLIVPAELETTAEQLLSSTVDPSKSNATPNPFVNKMEIIVDAILDNDSTTAWYLAADYNQIDTIEIAFLNGQSAPTLESRQGWDVDGMEFKVRSDVATKAIDWRGMYKDPGSSS